MLIVVGGPMFSGKTTWLIGYLQKLPEESYVIAKPNIDTRYSDNECVSHDGHKVPAINLDIKNPKFPKLTDKVKTLLIDELNFFEPEALTKEIKKLLKQGRTVVGAGLLYDNQKLPFGATLPLSKIADKFVELFARCDRCGKKANHSYRKIKSRDQVILGAEESYGACCETCWSLLNQVK